MNENDIVEVLCNAIETSAWDREENADDNEIEVYFKFKDVGSGTGFIVRTTDDEEFCVTVKRRRKGHSIECKEVDCPICKLNKETKLKSKEIVK